jgi:hypothetical protein
LPNGDAGPTISSVRSKLDFEPSPPAAAAVRYRHVGRPKRRIFAFFLGAPFLLLLLAEAGIVATAGFMLLVIGLGIFMLVFVFSLDAHEATVGADGIELRERTSRRFVPWCDVAEVVAGGRTKVWIRLASGESIELVGSARGGRLPELVEDARAALASYRARGPSLSVPDTLPLERAGRSSADWLRGVRAVMSGAAGYRDAAVTDDVLWAILEDPRREPSTRLAAAAALAESAGDPGRARIRVVAEASAMPRLRLALEYVTEAQTDQQLEHALRVVDPSA